MKILGFILTALATLQAYLWLFGVIAAPNPDANIIFAIIIGVEFICGLLAAGVIEPIQLTIKERDNERN